ncbi:MAG: ABC transporter ATP-binding protein [Ilumatobacter sp.]|uniref:energy-coupling factor ABC transporter ATP-binding protein n=1 Tax=Ilumatobacter sp. TaxID=1967498 RepID=UPI003296B288
MTTEPTSTPIVVVRHLGFAYPDGHEVLHDVSVTIEPGERVAILGPNGAGKTTLVLHLNGINAIQQGTIEVGGLKVDASNLREIRRRVGMVFQNADDQLFMPTVREDVAFGPANLGMSADERNRRVDDALAAVGATHLADRSPHHLSEGEKRRAAIATVLSMDPQILVLDEPTSGFDPAGRRELTELLATIGLAQLIITHDLPFALQVCPRSIILSDGRIVADGPTHELLADTTLLEQHRLELPFGFDPTRIPVGNVAHSDPPPST